ncbi:myosin-4-like [Ostrinia nubilalis]|uniref:myosin-4-like n=1 Tax=Ostrinia nubilalis TaxID=29057 RepID=UPI0030825A38
MFSKAKRFEPVAVPKTQNKPKIQENENQTKCIAKTQPVASKVKKNPPLSTLSTKTNTDTRSLCSSTPSVKSFVTPKPVKSHTASKVTSSLKKQNPTKNGNEKKQINKISDDVVKAQEVEIRNKNHTILEHNKHIEELKTEIARLQAQINSTKNPVNNITTKLEDMHLEKSDNKSDGNKEFSRDVENFKKTILELELQCDKLEQEVSNKQVELSSLEEVITIRDSLCKDLQEKLTNMESNLEETRQRLEMVKGHHALALEANESIRREYKVELETLKTKAEEEKQVIINKHKIDQERIKYEYNDLIDSIKTQLVKEKTEEIQDLQDQLEAKEREFAAKLEQINEAAEEKLRLCEIQFEERTRNIQDHWAKQQSKIQYLEKETRDLKYSLNHAEEENLMLQQKLSSIKSEYDCLKTEKEDKIKEINDLKEEIKTKHIDFENEINKLTVEIDKAAKEKSRFEMSLSVTRDIVQVLTMRLRESDNELEHLENTVQTLNDAKDQLENELAQYKNTLNNTVLECNEYKEALVNILKSKAALAKEHNRIMEHNVTLIESLQNVEKEAYRELGSIKNELIEDVELLKKESNSQIQQLRDEVENKRLLCELATEHAGQAAAAAEQARALLAHAANEVARLEADNQRFQNQIQDQQSLVVELSLLRQENEELSMTVAKQSSIIDKMKKDMDQVQAKPKSPSVLRKSLKIGKENVQTVISPLRERNH